MQSPQSTTMFSVSRSRATLAVEIPGVAAPDRCASTLCQETADVFDRGGPCLMSVVVRTLGRLAIRAGHRETAGQSSPGTGKAFGCFGRGRSGTEKPGGPPF